ncbi:hypothetical protein [Halalkalibacterium ligniniphilum]|uniref:hypothetical protein n=1 Tax=Halalkalibacterium ligniniphilum TaxID=1134413 RepID=UPI00034CAFE6|nr:hypothetical protein [Halalkalibacterium ligniniphilum]
MWKLAWNTCHFLHFSFSVPYIQFKQTNGPTLILVKNERELCQSNGEKELYEQLIKENMYPTPQHRIGHISINLALVPYRIALMEKKNDSRDQKIMRKLRKKRWHVLYFEQDSLATADACSSYIQSIFLFMEQEFEHTDPPVRRKNFFTNHF